MHVYSKEVLNRLGYEYLYKVEEGKEPEYASIKFKDIIAELGSVEIGSRRLYKHQYEGLVALKDGFNLILRSGTGSGKTEVWVIYVMEKIREQGSFRALVLYPTLALANDQIKRINKYLELINDKPLQLDSIKRQELVREIGKGGLRDLVARSNVIISNPAFILHDLKKLLIHPTQALLYSFYKNIDLIIVDEIDFYGPRSLALLLAMLNILSKISDKKPQIAVLTATLSNPEDLGEYLEKITGRKYIVVEGKPFSIENHLYIVLGKNLKIIWEILQEKREVVKNIKEEPVRQELLKAIDSYEYFSTNLHRIISMAHSYDIDLPLPTIDTAEIIKEYLSDEYVTIVFTYSISQAEELVRTIKFRYGEKAPIAAHHHLVPKKKREDIEEKTRRGEIKVIVSPRTLSQGIDIGLVKRIVHLGLPDDVREFYQREGRKGRRRELGFSETIIIPHSRWDRELFSKGFEVFEKWLGLGIEKTLINPDNLYIHLFIGVAKLLSPWYREELSSLEKEALRRAGVLRDDRVNTNLLKWIFERMNFYEFAPPYGIKRYLLKNDEKIPLEPIGHCDLVEKFQPGNIDYSEEAIVTHIETGRSTRHVRAVIEKPIREINFYEDDAFAVALEEYRYIKMNWGEKPNILRDILAGRLTSEELCVVYTPWNGFGKYRKIPDRCIWRLRSEKPRVMVKGNKAIVYYDRRQIYVPKPTAGEYRDYTYGYTYCVNPDENSELMRLGLAMLMILLRRKYGIPFETIMYDVIKLGEYKYFNLHEPESAGIIDKIDWLDVRKKVEEYSFDDLDLILLSEIDDISYSILISYDFDWDTVRQEMIRLVDYILTRERIRVLLRDIELTIPKPSPGLKLLSISIMTEIIGEETEMPQLLVGINIYDGGEHIGEIALYPPIPYIKPPREIISIEERILEKIMYEEYRVIVPEKNTFLKQLRTANLRYLSMIIEKAQEKLLEINMLRPKLVSPSTSYEEVVYTAFPDMRRIEPAKIREVLSKINQSKRIGKREKEEILNYLRNQSMITYYAYLLLSELKKKVLEQ